MSIAANKRCIDSTAATHTASAADDVRTHGLRTLAILSLLMAFASISTDLYLPALPTMAATLQGDAGRLEFTISGYLIGFSLGQLLWGPISDRYGRRVPVAIGLVLFIIGSAGCAMSTSTDMMIGWRLVQAIGACASVVLARAMVRDLYEGQRAAQMMSTLMTVMAIAPLVGPTLGGQILHWFSWPAIFWSLVGVGLLTLSSLLLLPETLPPARRRAESPGKVFFRYGHLLADRRFLGYAATGGFFYGGSFAYIAGSPFAYIAYHHVRPELYGLLFAAGIGGLMVNNLLNARLLNRVGSDTLMRAGTVLAALAGASVALNTWTDWGGLPVMVVSLFLFVSATGLIAANATAGALSIFPEFAGAASALTGAIQYGSGILGSALVAVFADGTPRAMGMVVALCGLGSLLGAVLLLPRQREDAARATA